MRAFCQKLLDWRWAVLLVAISLAAGSAFIVTGLRFSFSFTQFFPSRDVLQVDKYFRFMQLFGRDDGLVFVALESPEGRPGFLTGPRLHTIDKLGKSLAAIDGVVRLDSLATLRLPNGDHDTLAAKSVVNAADYASTQTLSHLQKLIAEDPFARQFASPDGRTAALLLRLRDRAAEHFAILQRVKNTAEEQLAGSDLILHMTGVPVVRGGYIRLLAGETLRLVLLAGFILSLVLWLLFRTWRAVLMPVFAVSISVLLSVALLVVAGQSMTLMSTLIPAVVMVLGVADSVHLMARFQEERLRGHDVREAVVRSFSHLAVACFLTSLTTAVGFAALQISAIDIVSNFGLFAALGVMIAYLVTVLVLPPLLYLLPLPTERSLMAASKNRSGRFLAWHFRIASRRPRLVTGAFAVLSLALLLWSSQALSREAFFVDDLPADNAVVVDTRFVEKYYAGILPIDVVITGKKGIDQDPQALALERQVSTLLRTMPDLGGVLAYSDGLLALSHAAAGDDSLLQSRPGLAQLRLLADSGDSEALQRLVSADGSALRISTRVPDLGTPKMEALLAGLNQRLQNLAKKSAFAIELNGFTPAAMWVNRYMVNQLFYGFGLAFILITLLFFLLFRSFKLALIALAPNLFPVLGVLGWMTLTGIALKPTTAIIFSVAFGLGVDNNIHFLARYRDELCRGIDPRRAVARSMAGAGRGILFSSLVLSLGFCGVLLAQLATSRQFAVLAIATIVSALFAVLLMLPSLLLTFSGGSSEKS